MKSFFSTSWASSAITHCSSVGMTKAATRLEAVLIFASFLALAAASIPTPSHANCSHTAARICGWFSPTPAVSAVTLLSANDLCPPSHPD